MTPLTAWHPGEDLLQAYVDGGLPGLSAASVEAHLLSCSTCREQVRGGVSAERMERVRDELDDRLDLLRRPWSERFLVRCGLPEADARGLLAAPSLRRAWWLAVAAAAVLGLLVAGDTRDPDALFLVVAPVVPLAATALAYAPALDPAFRLVAATPYRTIRLLLARSLAVGLTAMVGVAAAALALPARDLTAVVWLLPAVALTLLVLALAPAVGTGRAAGGVGAAWLCLVVVLERQGVDVSWIADAAAQVGAGVLAVCALVVLTRQSSNLDRKATP
jgi:hypothetical protein